MALLRRTTLQQLADAPLTYAEVGATREGPLPAGYDHVERAEVVGSGRAAFDRAAAAVFRWGAQRGAGLRVLASGPASTPGTVVLMTAGFRRLGLDIPCRVVWVVDEPDRRGFGYGTLPGHPESGEESFVVVLRPDGEVVYELRAFSRPGTLLTRLGGPVATRVQSLALDRYVATIRRAAHRQSPARASARSSTIMSLLRTSRSRVTTSSPPAMLSNVVYQNQASQSP